MTRDRPRLDVLVANAGVYAPERRETADGLELRVAVNVVSPIVLAAALLPALRAAGAARIVIVSSASHWTGELHWDDLQLAAPGAYDGLRAYDQSKLAVLMLTLALARRLEGSGVTAVGLDPGDVATAMLASGWPGLPGIPARTARSPACTWPRRRTPPRSPARTSRTAPPRLRWRRRSTLPRRSVCGPRSRPSPARSWVPTARRPPCSFGYKPYATA